MSEYIVRIPPDMPYEIRAELNAWYVESEPIVRCRDCRHCEHIEYTFKGCEQEWWSCTRDWSGENTASVVEPDGFCKWGERRDA